MFFQNLLLVVSLTSFLRDFHISCCDDACADNPVFTPSRLVVKYGDPTSARCSICQHCQSGAFDVETPQGVRTKNGTTVTWTVNSLTEFAPPVTCYYNDDNTGEQCCTTLPVTLYKPPDNVTIFFDPQMFEGRPDTLSCDVSIVAPIENLAVTFYRGQTRLGQSQTQFNDTEKKPVPGVYTLTVTPSKEDDGGQFWCEAKLELGPEGPQPPPVVRSERVTATVDYKPQLISTPPSEITVREGDPLQLDCSAVGNPSPSYTWTLPFTVSSRFKGRVFTISSVSSEDGGQYTCSVSNDMGNVTVKFKVIVRYKPQLISTSLSEITVREGDPLQLDCSAVGNPSPSYTWMPPFTVSSRFKGRVFTISYVSSKDGGQYTCSVSNDMGNVTVKFKVIVRYKPQLVSSSPSEITVTEGDPLQLNCSAVGNPSPSYTWTPPLTVSSPFNGTISSVSSKDGGQYTCSVSNDMGNVTMEFKVVVKGPTSPSNRLQPTAAIHWFILCFMILFCALV